MPDTFRVIGADEAERDLNKWLAGLPKSVEKGLESFQQQLRGDLAGRVPFLTGTLSSSAAIKEGGEAPDTVFSLVLGEDVIYAGWIEFGGSRGRELVPQGRYVYPLALESEPHYQALAEKATTDAIETYPWFHG